MTVKINESFEKDMAIREENYRTAMGIAKILNDIHGKVIDSNFEVDDEIAVIQILEDAIAKVNVIVNKS